MLIQISLKLIDIKDVKTLFLIALFSFNSYSVDFSYLKDSTKGLYTDVFIVEKDNEKVIEKYFRGYDKNSKHFSWSMAKTIAGIIFSKAVDEKLIDFDEKLNKYFTYKYRDPSILNIAQMSSGIKFKESYTSVPVDADVIKMLYLDGVKDGSVNYTLSLSPRKELPGKHYYYSSGDSNIMMGILQKVMTKEKYLNYPWVSFFDPLEIKASFEIDSKGTFLGSSYMYMTPEEYLKIGRLILNDGIYKGRRIISKSYLKLLYEPARGAHLNAVGSSMLKSYSMQTSLNKFNPIKSLPPEFSHLPEDSIIIIGHQGQLLVVSKSANLIILRLATDRKKNLDRNKFFKDIYLELKEKNLSYQVSIDSYRNEYDKLEDKAKDKSNLSRLKNIFQFIYVPKLIKRLAAKEYCSCTKVVKRKKELCLEDLKNSLPILPFFIEEKDNIISSSFLFFPAKAEFINEKLGCRLLHN